MQIGEPKKRTTVTRGSSGTPARSQGRAWWVVSRHENCRREVLTVPLAGEEAVPVFSHQEEAALFLLSDGLGDGWHVRESRPGELASMLVGVRADVKRVALDPLPSPWCDLVFDISGCWDLRAFFLALVRPRGSRDGHPGSGTEPESQKEEPREGGKAMLSNTKPFQGDKRGR